MFGLFRAHTAFYSLLKCRYFKIIRLLLDEKTNDIYQKLNSQAYTFNNEVKKFNNVEVKINYKFCMWKKGLKGKNDVNMSLITEASKLIFKYQQKMYVQVLLIIIVAFLPFPSFLKFLTKY